jgi:hypothetical protein
MILKVILNICKIKADTKETLEEGSYDRLSLFRRE